MARAAARLRDTCTGHSPGFPPRANNQGSPDVFINGLPAHRQYDSWLPHCYTGCHPSNLASGSPTVLTNGLQQGRVGDPVMCGSFVAVGSQDVFIGDSAGDGGAMITTAKLAIPYDAPTGGRGSGARYSRKQGGGYEVYEGDEKVAEVAPEEEDELQEEEDVSGLHLAWGKKVSSKFRARVFSMATQLGMDKQEGADWLMSVMAFESGETFSPGVRNPNSSATGLIQFMRKTAPGLGTTVEALAKMTAEQQLEYVYKHLKPYSGRFSKIEDLYMAVLLPSKVSAANSAPLFTKPSKAYKDNGGLDLNKDGVITKGEAGAKVREKYKRGHLPAYLWKDGQG